MHLTPTADLIRKRLSKSFQGMTVIPIARFRNLPIRKFPNHFRKSIQYIRIILTVICFRKICGKRHMYLMYIFRMLQDRLIHNLRFIAKNGGNGIPEFFSDCLKICFVGKFDKAMNCLRIQCINVALPVKTRSRCSSLPVCMPYIVSCFAIGKPPVRVQISITQINFIASKKRTVPFPGKFFWQKVDVLCPQCRVFCNFSTRKP